MQLLYGSLGLLPAKACLLPTTVFHLQRSRCGLLRCNCLNHLFSLDWLSQDSRFTGKGSRNLTVIFHWALDDIGSKEEPSTNAFQEMRRFNGFKFQDSLTSFHRCCCCTHPYSRQQSERLMCILSLYSVLCLIKIELRLTLLPTSFSISVHGRGNLIQYIYSYTRIHLLRPICHSVGIPD